MISPGPGDPYSAGICIDVVKNLGNRYPIFGVCLGHQVITEAFGGKVVRARLARHGKTSMMKYEKHPLFEGVSNPFEAMRYHSLVAQKKSVPVDIQVIAVAEDSQDVMAIAHKSLPIYGVQFHPESIGTPEGSKLVRNFFRLAANN